MERILIIKVTCLHVFWACDALLYLSIYSLIENIFIIVAITVMLNNAQSNINVSLQPSSSFICTCVNSLVPIPLTSLYVLCTIYVILVLSQLARLQELEELLKEQEATIASLNEKLENTKASLQAENHALVLKKDKEIKKFVSCLSVCFSVSVSMCDVEK